MRVRGNLIAGEVEVVHEGQGSLRLITTPEVCYVLFNGELQEKTRSIMNMTHIPAGEYTLVLRWGGLELRHQITIRNGQRAIVRASFMKNAVPFAINYEPEKTSRW